jgi:hypothetical protein
LYLHLHQNSFTRDATGVARFEGVGPVTAAQAIEILGDHCHVTIRPVIDIAHQAPVDGYETPAAMREALQLRNPTCVSPWATQQGRHRDAEHTVPYLDPDKGGPPGQTSMENLALIGRFPHRLKTHGRWRLKQPTPGTFLWRSPNGWYFYIDHTGTHPIPKQVGDTAWTHLASNTTPGVIIDLHPAGDINIDYTSDRHDTDAA